MQRIVNYIRTSRWLPVLSLVVICALVLALIGVRTGFTPQNSSPHPSNVITIGSTVSAAGTADYTCDGVADNAEFQLAINALPVTGGKIIALAGTYSFVATVTPAVAKPNVTIEGVGRSTYFTYNAANFIFTANDNNWVFTNLRTDAGSLNMGATTGWLWQNVTINATYYALRSENGVTGASFDIPTGRGVTLTVAASNASAAIKAQADYVCDGTADNVEIQAAINALPAGGGTVSLSEGTFTLASPLSLGWPDTDRPGTHLQGQGFNTIITTVNGFSGAFGIIKREGNVAPLVNIAITDLQINGNTAGQAGGSIAAGIWLSNLNQAVFKNLYLNNNRTFGLFVTRGAVPVFTNQSVNVLVDNVIASNNIWDGLAYTSDYAVFSNNICRANGRAGLTLEESRYITINGGEYQGNTECGIDFAAANFDIMVTGVISRDNTQAGIAGLADDVTITGSEIYGNQDGLYVVDSNRWVISGNVIRNNTRYGMDFLVSGATLGDMTITGNQIYNNTQQGIFSQLVTGSFAITGNTISTNGHSGINLIRNTSTGNIISNNVIKMNGRCGIDLDQCSYTRIMGNVITGNSTTGAGTFNGVLVQGGGAAGASWNEVSGNRIYGANHKYAIEEIQGAGGAEYNSYHDNHINPVNSASITGVYSRVYNNTQLVSVSEDRQAMGEVLQILGDVRGFWPCFETGATTTITDYSRRTHNLTASSNVNAWATAPDAANRGIYYTYDGANNYAFTVDHADFEFDDSAGQGFTMVAVANVTNTAALRVLLSKFDSAAGATQEYMWSITATDEMQLTLHDAVANKDALRTTNAAITQGSWRVFIVTYDGSGGALAANGIIIYENGVVVASTATNDALYVRMRDTACNVVVGGAVNGAGYSPYYRGSQSWLTISGTVLTPDQIWQVTQLLRGVFGI